MSDYNIFRWYRAGWGRYSQSDRVVSTVNLYSYVDANPLTWVDVLGLYKRGDVIYRCNAIACDVAFVWDDRTPCDDTNGDEQILAYGPTRCSHKVCPGGPPVLTNRDGPNDPYKGMTVRGVWRATGAQRKANYQERWDHWNEKWSPTSQCYDFVNHMTGRPDLRDSWLGRSDDLREWSKRATDTPRTSCK